MNHRAIQLTDIPLRDLVPVKVTVCWIRGRDHSRWVLRTRHNGDKDGRYFKIWNPTYVRRDSILSAIACGFYDDRTTPALDGLVFHHGICRGYVMTSGVANRRRSPEFFDLVTARTRQTRHFHVQFSASHTITCKRRISLVDLEAVWPMADYPKYRGEFDDIEYERFVAELYREIFPDRPLPRAPTDSNRDCRDESGIGNLARLPHRLRRASINTWQRLRIRARNHRPCINLIET